MVSVKALFLSLCFSALVACGSSATKSGNSEYPALYAQYQADTENLVLLQALADLARHEHERLNSVWYRDQAIHWYRLYRESVAGHIDSNSALYVLLMRRSLQEYTREHVTELHQIYTATPKPARVGLVPPSLIEAFLSLSLPGDYLNKALALSRKALQENPAHIGTRLFMVRLYRKQGDMGSARKMLNEAYQLAPESPKVLQEIALMQQAQGSLKQTPK